MRDKEDIAADRNTPPEVLEQLSRDEDGDVRYCVANNTKTPPELLEKLSEDEDGDVRLCAARNPNTPPEALERLSQDEDWLVRWHAAQNPSITINALWTLYRQGEEFNHFLPMPFEQVLALALNIKDGLKKRVSDVIK